MTVSHRLQDNPAERARSIAAGHCLAPLSLTMEGPAKAGQPGIGPLRVWPGGLCVARGIGDSDVGRVVLAQPHIRQVILPPCGARLIIASDGVWDAIPSAKLSKLIKGKSTAAATKAVIAQCVWVKNATGGITDDTTVMIADFVANNTLQYQPPCSLQMSASAPDAMMLDTQSLPPMMQLRGIDVSEKSSPVTPALADLRDAHKLVITSDVVHAHSTNPAPPVGVSTSHAMPASDRSIKAARRGLFSCFSPGRVDEDTVAQAAEQTTAAAPQVRPTYLAAPIHGARPLRWIS